MPVRFGSSRRRGLMLTSLAAASVGVSMIVSAVSVEAACHAFTITASPTAVSEGREVVVTVHRDAAVNPSTVDVRTVDGSAKNGQDFAGGRRTVSFTTETAKSYPITVINDRAAEPTETFRVELVPGSGGGCTVNPNFTYGPPSTITIAANDQSSAVVSPSPPKARPRRSASARPSAAAAGTIASPRPIPSKAPTSLTPPAGGLLTPTSPPIPPTTEATPAPRDASSAAATPPGNGGPPTVVVVLAIVLSSLAVAGGLAYARRRRSVS